MNLYLLIYKTLFPTRYRDYLQRAGGNHDKLKETLLHKTYYEEYDRYDFIHKDDAERRAYITDHYRNKVCKRINNDKEQALIMNKYRTALLLKDYYGRQFMQVNAEQDRAAFVSFGLNEGALVAKPVSDCGGRGVRLLTAVDDEHWGLLFNELLAQERPFIVEQRIQQHPFMSRYNSSSVNTIRINTFQHKGTVRRFTSIIKTGRSGSFVDNGAQGGVMALVDSDTGVVVTDAIDDMGHAFTHHPDSGIPFRGEQVPRWDELIQVTTAMALLLPKLTFVGWDMALTPQGWVVVEGNKGEFFAEQIVLKRGLKKEFDQYCFPSSPWQQPKIYY